MGRTCEPAMIANQILYAVSQMLGANPRPEEFEQAARRECSRCTFGLRDYERDEVMCALAIASRGVVR